MTGSELILCFCKPSKTHTLISSLKLLGRRLLHFVIKYSVLWRSDFKISSPHYNFGAKLSDLADKSLVHPVWRKIISSVWSNHLPAFSHTLTHWFLYLCVPHVSIQPPGLCARRACDSAALPSIRTACLITVTRATVTSLGPFVSLDVGSSTWVSNPWWALAVMIL